MIIYVFLLFCLSQKIVYHSVPQIAIAPLLKMNCLHDIGLFKFFKLDTALRTVPLTSFYSIFSLPFSIKLKPTEER